MDFNVHTPPLPTGGMRGKLKILYRLHNTAERTYLCKCMECGAFVEVNPKILIPSNIKKKCIQCVHCHNGAERHGLTKTRLYRVWVGMKNRENNHDKQRPTYKGKTMCKEWKNSFIKFKEWALLNGYQDNLTIDRIDNDKGYSPSNCRWATPKQQVRNRSNTKLITYKGETKPLMEWCEILNLNYNTTWTRLSKYKWTIEKAFEKGVR